MELVTDQGCWVVAEIIMSVAGETIKQIKYNNVIQISICLLIIIIGRVKHEFDKIAIGSHNDLN